MGSSSVTELHVERSHFKAKHNCETDIINIVIIHVLHTAILSCSNFWVLVKLGIYFCFRMIELFAKGVPTYHSYIQYNVYSELCTYQAYYKGSTVGLARYINWETRIGAWIKSSHFNGHVPPCNIWYLTLIFCTWNKSVGYVTKYAQKWAFPFCWWSSTVLDKISNCTWCCLFTLLLLLSRKYILTSVCLLKCVLVVSSAKWSFPSDFLRARNPLILPKWPLRIRWLYRITRHAAAFKSQNT